MDFVNHFHSFFDLSHKEAHNNFLWIAFETFILTFVIMCIIELAGRKSVGQLSMIQTVVFISIGEVVLMPVIQSDFHFFKSIIVVLTLVIFLIIMEFLQMKFNLLEKLFVGKAKIIIENGELDYSELKKQRLTVDQLESQLRSLGVINLNHLKTVTFESNGKVGYELKEEYQPLTRKEFFEALNKEIPNNNYHTNNIFEEIRKGHDSSVHDKYK